MTPVTEATPAVKLTERINRIEPSATMAVVAEADKLRQQGIDVVDFGAGEPHFSTPQHVKDAAIAAIQNNFSKYTAVGGTAELRDAIVHRHAADFQSDYRREESMASVGGKHACSTRFRCWSTTAMKSFCRCPTGCRSKTSCATRAAIAYCFKRTRVRDSGSRRR